MPPPALKLALYYPYIRIRDVEWLKATLLCFPQVRRIVPDSYMPIDSDEIRAFLNTEGQYGPLLTHSASLMEYPVAMQMGQLGEWMKEHLPELHWRYNVEETQKEFRRDAFQIHKGKISPSIGLMEMLEAGGLAWQSRGHDSHFWISMHPRLGRIVMSTIAAAIAKFDGLAIVTPSTQAHYKISGLEGKELWESLLKSNELILGIAVGNATVTAGSGFITRFNSPGGNFCVEDKIVTAQGNYDANFVTSNTIQHEERDAAIATFY